MKVTDLIKNRIDAFKSLCKSHKVKFLYAFGSSVTNDGFTDESDIDLIVEIDSADPLERGENLLSLWDGFEIFFHRKVDLLTETSIKNPFLKKSIDSTKVKIYDQSGEKVFI